VKYLSQTDDYLRLILEAEVLLGGGQTWQSGLPTVLQSLLQTCGAAAIGLSFGAELPNLDFSFPLAHGQTALLWREETLGPYWQRQTPILVHAGPHSLVLCPVLGPQNRYGLLQLAFHQGPDLSEGHLLFLQLLGRKIGTALENAEGFALMRRETYELGILSRIGDSLLSFLSSLQIEKVAGRIMNAVKDLLEVEEASIMIKDVQSGDLILWQHTPPELNVNIRLKPGQGIAGWVLAEGRPAIVNDVRQDSRWASTFDQQGQFITRSLLAVPILLEGANGQHREAVGVVEAVNKIRGVFTEADEKWLSGLAKWAAIAISNAHTYDELRRTHERLADAKKQAAMAQMVLNLAHKINNSVGAVRVWALEGLDDMSKQGIPYEPYQVTLENILNNAEETLLMVRRIREATEPKVGSLQAVNVQDVLETALVVSRLSPEVQVIRQYERGLPFVRATPERLIEAFVNLIDNAADVMGHNGTLTLGLHRNQKGEAEVLIADDGAGIPEHLRASLFDPFVSSKSEGLGLGLWMVKLYIELIGGQIAVTTATGKGTHFRMSFPPWEG
jgi:signal transduction histidine kinase